MKTILSLLLACCLVSVVSGEFVEFEGHYRHLEHVPIADRDQWPVVAIGFDADTSGATEAGSIDFSPDGSYLHVWENGTVRYKNDSVHLLGRSVGVHHPTSTNPAGRATVMFHIRRADRQHKLKFSATVTQYQIVNPWTDTSLEELYHTAFPSNLDTATWRQPTFTYWDGERHLFDVEYRWQRVGNMVGDSDFDNDFDFDDVLTVLGPGKFETGQPALWSQGDWDRDGFFAFEDILLVLGTVGSPGGHAAQFVPEPSSLFLGLLGMLGILQATRRATR